MFSSLDIVSVKEGHFFFFNLQTWFAVFPTSALKSIGPHLTVGLAFVNIWKGHLIKNKQGKIDHDKQQQNV